MWCTQVELQKRFCLGSTFVTKICRLIDDNIDIYGKECKARKRYSPLAFYHAYQNWESLEIGQEPEPYEPEKIARYLISMHEETAEDYFDAGIRRCRNELYRQLDQFFLDTEVPKDCKQVARVLRSGVLATVMTGEVESL